MCGVRGRGAGKDPEKLLQPDTDGRRPFGRHGWHHRCPGPEYADVSPHHFRDRDFDDSLLAQAKTPNTSGYIIMPFCANDLVSNIEIALFTHRCRAGPAAAPEPAARAGAERPVPAEPAAAQAGRQPDQSHRIRAGIKNLYDHAFHLQSKGKNTGALQYFIEILEKNPEDTLV